MCEAPSGPFRQKVPVPFFPHGAAAGMNILIVTPAPPRSSTGNRTTALRWARILRQLGHRVRIVQHDPSRRCDLMVALHARRSAPAIKQFHRDYPDLPLIVTLTGTDLYDDIQHHAQARKSLQVATRLIVLHGKGADELPAQYRRKTRVIYQSATPPPTRAASRNDVFEVCVVGHLRTVKDPFRTAEAARLLPPPSRIRVVHLGAALDEELGRRARREADANPRYRWLGDQPRWKARRILARSRLLVHSSQMEGGANVISEALACSVPILSSCIPGSVGLLGADYAGYFTFGDTQALADLMTRAETDEPFYRLLKKQCEKRAYLVEPAREQQAWAELIRETCQ